MTIQVKKWRPRGPVYFGARDETTTPAGPGALGQAHCVDQVTLATNIEYITHDAKCSGIDAEDKRDIKKFSGEVSIDFSNYTPETLVLALAATKNVAEVAPATETDEDLPEVLTGESAILGGANPNFNITGLTITDSATVPATLTVNDDYTLDAKFGMVTFGDVSGFTQPFVANYSHQNPAIFAALAAGTVQRWIRFNGTNIVDGNKIVPVDMFKCQFTPTTGLDLLPDEYGKLSLKASVLQDQSRETDDPLGQFFAVGQA